MTTLSMMSGDGLLTEDQLLGSRTATFESSIEHHVQDAVYTALLGQAQSLKILTDRMTRHLEI